MLCANRTVHKYILGYVKERVIPEIPLPRDQA